MRVVETEVVMEATVRVVEATMRIVMPKMGIMMPKMRIVPKMWVVWVVPEMWVVPNPGINAGHTAAACCPHSKKALAGTFQHHLDCSDECPLRAYFHINP
jgi:hypothetical protein